MASARHTGWKRDLTNGRLAVEYLGTEVFDFDADDMVITPATTVTGALTASAGVTATTGGLTVTAGGATITAGGLVVTAGDAAVTAGNLRLGAISAFATTEPTSAVVMKSGTAPSGAIATSSGIYSNDTVLRKFIADGTLSNVA